MHSDSSDDENLELLKEAQDNVFLTDSLFKNPKAHLESVEDTSKKQINASLRKSKDENEQFNLFGVTPEFQNYISKHLSGILDEKLEKNIETEVSHEKHIKEQTKVIGGIKLFSDSENFLETSEYQGDNNIKYFKNSQKHFNKLCINKEDFKSLAVSGEAILQKVDLKYWSNRTKGKVYLYKKVDNGQLMLVE